jgi:hypothetical protein
MMGDSPSPQRPNADRQRLKARLIGSGAALMIEANQEFRSILALPGTSED